MHVTNRHRDVDGIGRSVTPQSVRSTGNLVEWWMSGADEAPDWMGVDTLQGYRARHCQGDRRRL